MWRYGLAALVAATTLLTADPDLPDSRRVFGLTFPLRVATEVVAFVLGASLMRFRRRSPLLVVALLNVLSIPFETPWPLLAWAYLSLAKRRRWREIAVAAPTVTAGWMLALWVSPQSPFGRTSDPTYWADVALYAAMTALMVAALTATGMYLGARHELVASLREQVDQVHREQELRLLAAQADERNRIAREMHDVLAHRLSLVSLHAGALAYRSDLTSEQVREAATTIRDNAHASLQELRTILGSLRAQDEPGRELLAERPQPTLADIGDLVDAQRALGQRITVSDTVVHPELLPTATGRHAYRIVQEALTNAGKHARTSAVTVELSGQPGGSLAITVSNPLTGAVRADATTSPYVEVPGSRVGLVGVAERATSLGGTASHSNDGHQFRLEVRLPW